MCACVNPKRSPVFQNPPACLPLLELFTVPVPCSVFPTDPLPAQIPTKFAHSFQPKYVPLTPLPPHIRHLPCIPLPLHISCNPTTGNCFRPAPLLVPPSRQLCGATVPNATRVRRPSFTTNPPFQFSGNPWPVPQLPCPPTALLGRQPLAAYVSSLPTPPIDRRPPRPILSENPASRPPP